MVNNLLETGITAGDNISSHADLAQQLLDFLVENVGAMPEMSRAINVLQETPALVSNLLNILLIKAQDPLYPEGRIIKAVSEILNDPAKLAPYMAIALVTILVVWGGVNLKKRLDNSFYRSPPRKIRSHRR